MGGIIGDILEPFTGTRAAASRQAGAAQSAAEAQAAAQERSAQLQVGLGREQLAFAKSSQERAVSAAESPQELAALEKSLRFQERDLERQEQLIEALDPALREAATQSLAVLKGEGAAALGPVRRQRERQRKLLVDRLREQLGPGAETSSIGRQALNQFDAQSSEVALGGLGTLQSFLQTGAATRGQFAGGGRALAAVGGGFGNIASRRVAAITGAQPGITQAFGAQQQAQAAVGRAQGAGAAAPFIGEQIRGAAELRQSEALIGLAGTIGAGFIAGGD